MCKRKVEVATGYWSRCHRAGVTGAEEYPTLIRTRLKMGVTEVQ